VGATVAFVSTKPDEGEGEAAAPAAK
jgi:hypothetical protein